MLLSLRLRPHCMPMYVVEPRARCKDGDCLLNKPFVVFNSRLNSILKRRKST